MSFYYAVSFTHFYPGNFEKIIMNYIKETFTFVLFTEKVKLYFSSIKHTKEKECKNKVGKIN